MRRENTFKIDYSNFPLKPSYEKIHVFCRTVLGLKREEVQRLQCHRAGSCAFVKVSNLALAQKVVEEHDEKHEVESDGKKYKLKITLEDGSVEVKVYDLPEDVSEAKIVEFLSAFGEVISIRELTWGEGYEFGGVPLGIWSVRMVLKHNIDSWVTIDGEQAFIQYKGQLQSCRYCHEQAHSGISCVQNKKLLVQKSYANVAKQLPPRQQQRKPIGTKPSTLRPPGAKPASTKPAERQTAVLPLESSEAFPELPKQSGQNDTSGLITPSTSTLPVLQQTFNTDQHSMSASHSRASSPAFVLSNTNTIDFFKKPGSVSTMRTTTNDNDTDDSSTSASSRRSRRIKKLRMGEDGENEKSEGYLR